MGPIEKMVQDIIDKKLSEEYPQVQLPAIMKAQVTKATPLADEYEYDELTVENKDSGSTFEAKITGKWFEYNLKILTKDGGPVPRLRESDRKSKSKPGVSQRWPCFMGSCPPSSSGRWDNGRHKRHRHPAGR